MSVLKTIQTVAIGVAAVVGAVTISNFVADYLYQWWASDTMNRYVYKTKIPKAYLSHFTNIPAHYSSEDTLGLNPLTFHFHWEQVEDMVNLTYRITIYKGQFSRYESSNPDKPDKISECSKEIWEDFFERHLKEVPDYVQAHLCKHFMAMSFAIINTSKKT